MAFYNRNMLVTAAHFYQKSNFSPQLNQTNKNKIYSSDFSGCYRDMQINYSIYPGLAAPENSIYLYPIINRLKNE